MVVGDTLRGMSLVIHNARIWTGSPERPWATSIRFAGGRVAAIEEPPRPGDDALDAGGACVIPGLIDAHVHLVLGGEGLSHLDLSTVGSRAAFEEAIARRHAGLPEGEWLIARGWTEANWGDATRPDKSWLRAAEGRPVVCHRMDIHAALVNDAVLARCDLARADAPGWGGRIVRDSATGEPTGLMIEAAAWELVNPIIPASSPAQRQDALRRAERHFLRLGVTAVGTMEYARMVEEVFRPLRDELRLRCRVTLLDRAWPMTFDYGRDFPNDDRLAVIGYKTFVDGTLGSRSARMLADYADDPGNRGLLLELAAAGTLNDWAQAVAREGLSPSIHAIGDESARLALDAIADLDPATGPRIEHAQHLHAADIARFAGVFTSMQPMHKADDGRYAGRRLGRDRLDGAFAFRRLADAGARLAFGSDWPVVTCDPLAGIRAAVTGRLLDGRVFRPDQNLSVEEALRAYTVGAADALRLDAGRLEPGRLADAVVLDADPFEADWTRRPPVAVATIVSGAVVHDARVAAGKIAAHG